MIPIHCSSLGLIMTDAKSVDPIYLTGRKAVPGLAAMCKKKVKADEEKEFIRPWHEISLSAGAKTELKCLVKEFAYGFNKVITTKYMEKGTMVEDQSIQLYNNVFFTNYKKNTERKKNEFLTGEVDIDTDEEIIDIKSAWDLSTFPAFVEDAHDPIYEWQLRGYFHLWERNRGKIAFCMVDTPPELIRYEQPELHEVSHIQPSLRVTCIEYARDMALEAKMIAKIKAAQEYMADMVALLKIEHNY